jgi:membrane protein
MWSILTETFQNWSRHNTARLGAALAYYSIFSLGPIIVISVAVAGMVFGPAAARGEISAQIRGLLGDAGAQAVDAMLAGASRPHEGMLATVIGIGTLMFAAVGVVVQLKDALNTVWNVEAAPTKGYWRLIRGYLVSLAGILALGFILLVSLVFTAALAAAGKFIAPYLPEMTLQLTGSGISYALVTLLLAMMFKWLPERSIAWGDVWLGAAVTAGLFEIGKFLIAFYIGKQGLESTYGAATSLVVLLVWVYYASQIVLLGAEFTHVIASRRARARAPRSPSSSAPPQRQGAVPTSRPPIIRAGAMEL